MARKKIAFGVGAGMVSLAIDGLSGLLIIRLLVTFLTPELSGYWILITSSGSFLLLLQCGLGPTVARQIARIRNEDSPQSLAELLTTIRIAFFIIALVTALAAILIYNLYLSNARKTNHIDYAGLYSWTLYAAGMVLNIQAQRHLFILNGFGEVGWDKVLRTISTLIGLILTWSALKNGVGIVGLGSIYLLQNILFWAVAAKLQLHSLPTTRSRARSNRHQLRVLFQSGSKILLLTITGYIVTTYATFFVERRYGIAAVTPFTAMMKIGFLLSLIATLIPQMLYPYIAAEWARQNFHKCRKYYFVSIFGSVATYLLMAIPFFAVSPQFFTRWLGDSSKFEPLTVLGVLLFYLAYSHNTAQAMPVLAAIGSAFVGPAIANAVLVPFALWVSPVGQSPTIVPYAMTLGMLVPTTIVSVCAWRTMTQPARPIYSNEPGF